MSDQEKEKTIPEKLEQLSDILLVMDQEMKKIMAVKGIGKNGELETVDPNEKNQEQFMRVDKNGDAFSNFFTNFFKQLKNPTRFNFFKVPALFSIDIAKKMQQQVNSPTEEGKKVMEEHAVKKEETKTEESQQKTEKNMETPNATPEKDQYRYKMDEVDWKTMENLGLSKETLEKLNLLDPLLKGYKTNDLVSIKLNLGSVVIKHDAKLSLQRNDQGEVAVLIHGIRREPTLNLPFFGHDFTKEDKENLLKTGHMGRIVDLKNPKNDTIIPSIISIDEKTKEIIALHIDRIKIPNEIKGVVLDDHQKQTLMEGKPLFIEGMTSKKGEKFDASVQYSAVKHYPEFLFNKEVKIGQTVEAPTVFRKKELDEDQHKRLKAGETVFISGLKDRKGKEYEGYITFNKDTGKTGFTWADPTALKEKIQPNESHKTQVAVNSEGKTNEATKNIKEPLKSAQQQPDSKSQQNKQRVGNSKPRKINS